MPNPEVSSPAGQPQWLKQYYFARAAFSILWVAAIVTIGQQSAALGAILLVAYPLWDAGANYVDGIRAGGLGQNRTQAINVVASLLTAVGVALTLPVGLGAVLTVFGVWAILSGLLQLGTAIRRWRTAGAQWVMILSGAQSALAGAFFAVQAQQPVVSVIPTVAGYAGFGAVYFLVSALWLSFRRPAAAAAS